jgi:hypothetical protein
MGTVFKLHKERYNVFVSETLEARPVIDLVREGPANVSSFLIASWCWGRLDHRYEGGEGGWLSRPRRQGAFQKAFQNLSAQIHMRNALHFKPEDASPSTSTVTLEPPLNEVSPSFRWPQEEKRQSPRSERNAELLIQTMNILGRGNMVSSDDQPEPTTNTDPAAPSVKQK